MQFGGEVNIGFVERNEEEGEDLMDFDEEYLGLLVEFCMKGRQLAIERESFGG